jgi:hypothetical protein
MPGALNVLSRMRDRLWKGLIRKPSSRAPDVMIHDPAASRPHDLDDPYFDQKVQSRIGDLIARAARNEPR